MKTLFVHFLPLFLLLLSCQEKPLEWDGPVLEHPRTQLTTEQLLSGEAQPLWDMSFFAKPTWAKEAEHEFSGIIRLEEAELIFPKEKEYYPGENVFPRFQIGFQSHEGELIPRFKNKIITRHKSKSLWDVVVGTGKVWQEEEDCAWSRASFPLTLTDRYIGQARNCVATFVYAPDSISQLCVQCSQETADIDDQQLGNLHGMIPASYEAKAFPDAGQVIAQHQKEQAAQLPIRPLSDIDARQEIADDFEQVIYTHAPTSLGAVYLHGQLYLHPPKTRHGLYPYPEDMRHGLYSVTKSMAGALALLHLEGRYEESVFDALITDYVPALEHHPGWQGVSFAHCLNMVTGTVGSERAEHLLYPLVLAETAEEAIHKIAALGDEVPLPGEYFNYASTNLFVLSYAMQQYVEEQEGVANYWDLVQENVLQPIGAEHFSLLHTIEADTAAGIPVLAYGALPTLDEAAKIALLFANGGAHNGQQLLNRKRVGEIFGESEWEGHDTHRDFRGDTYQHAFWSKTIRAGGCKVRATYMLGFGENYVIFLPSGAIIFRFLDEHDLNVDKLIKAVERVESSCG